MGEWKPIRATSRTFFPLLWNAFERVWGLDCMLRTCNHSKAIQLFAILLLLNIVAFFSYPQLVIIMFGKIDKNVCVCVCFSERMLFFQWFRVCHRSLDWGVLDRRVLLSPSYSNIWKSILFIMLTFFFSREPFNSLWSSMKLLREI